MRGKPGRAPVFAEHPELTDGDVARLVRVVRDRVRRCLRKLGKWMGEADAADGGTELHLPRAGRNLGPWLPGAAHGEGMQAVCAPRTISRSLSLRRGRGSHTPDGVAKHGAVEKHAVGAAARLTTLGSLLAALTGCGGGGGGGGTPPPVPVPYTLVALAPASLAGISSIANAISADGTAQGGVRFTNTNDARALLWNGTSASLVDLGPGEIQAIDVGVQIGFLGSQFANAEQAQLWTGTEASRVSLHPAGYLTSIATGGDATTQTGRARTSSGERHAMLWQGTAASAVDLHPAGFSASTCYDGEGTVQVGTGTLGGQDRALLWQGTAASVVDLGPGVVSAVAGNVQVGQTLQVATGRAHAMLWRGSEASRVDLHPAGFADSRAFAVAGNRQVGYGALDSGVLHAIVWEGTPESAIDLHSTTQNYLVDGGPPSSSFATGIDAAGNVVGWVRSQTGADYAVLWVRQ